MSPRKNAETEAAATAEGSDENGVAPSAAPSAATSTAAAPVAPELEGIADLSYEQARDELAGIVAALEGGQVPLEESMRQWRRGEALAAHCTRWLDGAQRQIEEALNAEDARPD